ncbi:hypothetical protein XO10_05675 [Marinitoga sp. 1135]|uniref:Uncharacterized protein n=1 Tax=Marinitoga piezophila (strain DSM 14283 / JCM 11233 / KA3) TaxID=443254 RepID=H2J853_MARPK|nr:MULTISPECIES: hypothetical protein [Marinitoga]AEX85544.1 hypothetical protein Marpi_1133 [Marinitoga piezophila KA3]APT76017.1 hypothetical protein LN42_06210 [Marinitoga sp. 1137]NUU95759.1 hypothetical protein [Marinitoga sp. 1135]NUU97681.1 hypothetical protein [Marinitoga sp. 1138]
MEYNKNLIYQLAIYLGTPSFYNLLGDLLKDESKSEKVVIVRAERDKWIILDAKGFAPEKLAYDSLEELLIKLEDVNMHKFPFNTYVLFDGQFEDKAILRILMMLFEKEAELYEKYRLETIIDRLSYQLAGLENLIKYLSKQIKEEDFVEAILGSLSEMFFSTVAVYSPEKQLIKKVGKLTVPDELELFEGMNLEKGDGYYTFNFTEEQKLYYDVFNIKCLLPYLKHGELKYIYVISRDTPFEKEETEILETIKRITQFFFEENAI